MEIGIRRGSLLIVFWALTGFGAFLIGRGGTSESHRRDDSWGASIARGLAAANGDEEAGSKTPPKGRRKANTVGRFIAVTRSLSSDELTRLLPEITEKMNLSEIEEAFARLEKVRLGPARRLAELELIHRLGQLDAMAAFARIESVENPDLREAMQHQAVKGWASVDPASAHAHLTESEGFDKKALRAVWEGIAKTNDLEKTLDFIPSLGAGSNAYSEPYEIWDIYMTLHDLYRKDNKTVVAWVEDLPPGEVRDRSFHSIVDRMARHDPLAAKTWIEELADPGNATEAYVELAESWARHDPEAAVEWISTLPPDTSGLRRIYERLFTRFIQYDFLDAANYLVAQEPSPALDTAFEVYIEKVKTIDPGSTMDWAVAITDEGRRWEAMQEVAGVWRERNSTALQEYVSEMDLSEAQQNALLGK